MHDLNADTDPPLHLVDIDASELPTLERDFIAEIFTSRLVGIVVRAAFPASAAARVIERLESGACGRYQHASGYWDGRVFGPNLQHTTPDLRDYFNDLVGFHAECGALFEGGPDFRARIEELLAYAQGGRRLSAPRGPAGEQYGFATIRGLGPGGEISEHCDIKQFESPAVRHLSAQLDVSSLLSYFVMLAMPESGGELHIHALRGDQEPGGPSAQAGGAVAPGGELVVPMAAGDLIVFNAGRYFHHVARVVGARARWTQGGFLSRSRDGASLFCWH